MNEHGTIPLATYVRTDFKNVVRTQAEERSIECGMMQRAKRETITYQWLGFTTAVRNNVSRVKQLLMPESAE